jgi:hypothetical protein
MRHDDHALPLFATQMACRENCGEKLWTLNETLWTLNQTN